MPRGTKTLDERKEEERKRLAVVPVPSVDIRSLSSRTHQELGNNMARVIRPSEFEKNPAIADRKLEAAQNGEKLEFANLTKNFRQLISNLRESA